MSYLQTYKALTDGGVPQEEALAAVLNPSLMRSLAAKYLGPRAQAGAARQPVDAAPSNASPPGIASLPSTASGQVPSPPSVASVTRALDGNFYAYDPNRPGKYLMVR
jgi:hypothetical protein